MPKSLVLAFLLSLLPVYAWAASGPNDCWFGVMALDNAANGQLVASGPVTQWRVGVPLVVLPTKENYDELRALADKGQTGTFDPSRPLTVIPSWISGPEPGDKDSGEDKEIQVMLKFSNAQGEHGTIALTYWGPMSGKEASLAPEQRTAIVQLDQQLHDMSCRGVP